MFNGYTVIIIIIIIVLLWLF